MARAKFTPTKEQIVRVSVLVACGTPQSEIARQVINPESGDAIDLKTLRKCFRYELDEGKKAANAMVARALFKRATGDGPQSVTAAIFWLKAQAGWRDRPEQEPVYQPPFVEQQDEPVSLGKKEQADRDAIKAQIGTAWERLLPSVPNQ